MPSLPASAGSSTLARAAYAASGHRRQARPIDAALRLLIRRMRRRRTAACALAVEPAGTYLAVRLHGTLPHGASSFSLVRRGTMIVGHTE